MTPARSPGLSLAALATLGLLAAAHPAHASTNIVQNGGFDAVDLGEGYFYTPAAEKPWTFTSNSGVIHPPSGFDSGGSVVYAPSGTQYAFIQSAGGGQGGGKVSQKLNLTAATTYNLSFLYAGRNNVAPANNGDASDLVSVTGPSGPGILYSSAFATASNDPFTLFAGSFTTVSGGLYDLTFANMSPSGDNTSFIENVDVSAAPEPSQLAGLAFTGFGALGLILKTRKRKASEVTA